MTKSTTRTPSDNKPKPSTGLYHPRFVDLTFALMGAGSIVLLFNIDFDEAIPPALQGATTVPGWAMLALLLLTTLATCLYHRIDRKGWDDYMSQIVTQSAMIAMVSVILVSTLFDFLVGPALNSAAPRMMIFGTLPVACGAWALGYGFLRWRGTNT